MSDRDPPRLTHLDDAGRARMVDVSGKPSTHRQAVATARIELGHAYPLWVEGALAKGDAAAVARIAGITAAKKTGELIPLAHPIMLTRVALDFETDDQNRTVIIRAIVETLGPTGVEMEAMTAASVAALTVYDMVKGVTRGARIREVQLEEKRGGASGPWARASTNV